MRREIRGKRGDEVASIESDDAMSDDDMDRKPAARPSRSPRGLAAAAEGNQVSLTEAAASGCRKCQRELRTGEKDRKTHDDQCPRKWRSVGKPPGASPSSAGVREEESEAEEEEDARGTDVVGGVSLEEAAEAGCTKCQLQLETGEKTRKVHADHCPRKYRGAVHKKSPEAEAVAMEVDAVKVEDRKQPPEKTFSNVEVAATPASPRKPPPQDPDSAVAEAPRKRGPGRPPSKKKKAGRPPSKRPSSPKNPASLADAAAAGCDKCKRELETGEKSRKTHDDHCPRKWRAKGTSPASAEAAALKSVEKSQPAPAQAAAKAPETPTRSSRRGKRTREQMLEKNATDEDEESAIAAMGLLAEATAKESGDNDDEGEVKPLRGGGGSEEDKMGLVPAEVLSAEMTGLGKQSAYNEDEKMALVDVELAKPLRGGGRTPKVKVEDGEEVKAATGSSPGATQPPDSPSRTSGRERKKPNVLDLGVGPAKEWGTPAADGDSPEPLRGGARPKKEDSATSDAAEAPAPARRGRPPTKQTKKGQKENAKRAPIKKETNNAIKGIGSAGRKPSALFDCPVCLDINKNKLCCYCACRLCFNKFGKEQTILCDKCDQEYHTFCLGLPKIPDEEWVCPACIDDEKKKKIAAQRKKVWHV